MAKNILLLFLSDVKTSKVGDKVLIQGTNYENVSGEECKTTNESAVRYLLEKDLLDKIFIFASKAVQQDIATRDGTIYLAEDGKPRTHLDFFLERVEKFLPNADCAVFHYDENNSGEENLKSVAAIAGQIQSYATGTEVTLHVDLTGGMRHINMMMLDLTRILEYSGLKIGSLLYSNFGKKKVEELKNIYDLFQLIAGVEEFVNFGSVTALKNYYADKNLSESLKKLLVAMENFAEAIKLCHYGQFHDAIIDLHDAVRDFAPTPDDVQDILMARLIERIREDYKRLIVYRELDDLEVIRWCLNHDYLQQALTLYTERIPEYLGAKKLITLRADEYKKLLKDLDGDVRSANFYLLNFYKNNDHDFNQMWITIGKELTKAQEEYCKLIKAIPDAIKNSATYDEWHAPIAKLGENLCFKVKLLYPNAPIAKEHIDCADAEKLRAQYELLVRIADNQFDNLSARELSPLEKFLSDKLNSQLEGAPPAKKRKLILNALKQLKGDEVKKYFAPLVSRRGAQIFRLKQMLDAQIFSVTFDEKIFFNVMEKYFRIKLERNQSNHAREDEGEFHSAHELRDFIFCALDELDAVLNK